MSREWQRPEALTQYYSIYEGGEIAPGYQIGSLEVSEFELVGDRRWQGSMVEMAHYVWQGTFLARDVMRWKDIGPVFNCETADEVIDRMFMLLASRQRSSGPFHAVRCSSGAP